MVESRAMNEASQAETRSSRSDIWLGLAAAVVAVYLLIPGVLVIAIERYGWNPGTAWDKPLMILCAPAPILTNHAPASVRKLYRSYLSLCAGNEYEIGTP